MRIIKYRLLLEKLLSELRPFPGTIYNTYADMAVTLALFLSFLQNKGNCIKIGKNNNKHGHTESYSKAYRELVGSVRDS